MKVYVKYSSKPPFLPEAIGDTKKQLAYRLGVKENNVLSSLSRGLKTYAEVEIEDDEE